MKDKKISRERFKKVALELTSSAGALFDENKLDEIYALLSKNLKNLSDFTEFKTVVVAKKLLEAFSTISNFDYDHIPSMRDELIACSPTIYHGAPGESALYFWDIGRNVAEFPNGFLLAEVLDNYGLGKEDFDELMKIQALVQPYDNAIMGFYFPKKIKSS